MRWRGVIAGRERSISRRAAVCERRREASSRPRTATVAVRARSLLSGRGGHSESERKHSDESEGGGGDDGDDGRNRRRIGGMTSAKVTSQNGTKSGPPNNAHR